MSAWRSFAEKPMAARAAKYCAVTALMSPTSARMPSQATMRRM